jgi:hypothetical protein
MAAYRTETLPDGSSVEVNHYDLGPTGSIISRFVDREIVWGQVFSMDTADEHAEQVESVLNQMRVAPTKFVRYPGRETAR